MLTASSVIEIPRNLTPRAAHDAFKAACKGAIETNLQNFCRPFPARSGHDCKGRPLSYYESDDGYPDRVCAKVWCLGKVDPKLSKTIPEVTSEGQWDQTEHVSITALSSEGLGWQVTRLNS